jgi:hypothetical protein
VRSFCRMFVLLRSILRTVDPSYAHHAFAYKYLWSLRSECMRQLKTVARASRLINCRQLVMVEWSACTSVLPTWLRCQSLRRRVPPHSRAVRTATTRAATFARGVNGFALRNHHARSLLLRLDGGHSYVPRLFGGRISGLAWWNHRRYACYPLDLIDTMYHLNRGYFSLEILFVYLQCH